MKPYIPPTSKWKSGFGTLYFTTTDYQFTRSFLFSLIWKFNSTDNQLFLKRQCSWFKSSRITFFLQREVKCEQIVHCSTLFCCYIYQAFHKEETMVMVSPRASTDRTQACDWLMPFAFVNHTQSANVRHETFYSSTKASLIGFSSVSVV